jgi:hypothetical protein
MVSCRARPAWPRLAKLRLECVTRCVVLQGDGWRQTLCVSSTQSLRISPPQRRPVRTPRIEVEVNLCGILLGTPINTEGVVRPSSIYQYLSPRNNRGSEVRRVVFYQKLSKGRYRFLRNQKQVRLKCWSEMKKGDDRFVVQELLQGQERGQILDPYGCPEKPAARYATSQLKQASANSHPAYDCQLS